jgi:hypothetical protein
LIDIHKGQKWPNIQTILFLAKTVKKGQMATLDVPLLAGAIALLMSEAAFV